ncbi:MAG: hypothetical protein AAFQ85_07200 [Pseudomonadota bacterium]
MKQAVLNTVTDLSNLLRICCVVVLVGACVILFSQAAVNGLGVFVSS